jgi:hypothetical protein
MGSLKTIFLERRIIMDKELEKLAVQLAKDEIKNAYDLENGSEAKSQQIENVVKICSMLNEDKRASEDREMKKAQRKDMMFDILTKAGIAIGTVALQWYFYDRHDIRHMLFEQTGTCCSPQTKALASRMVPDFKIKEFR